MVYKRLTQLYHWLLPATCPLCGASASANRSFCDGCESALPLLRHGCSRCAASFEHADLADSLCGRCQKATPTFAVVRTPFRYVAPIDRLIIGSKYAGRLDWARLLGERLAQHVQSHADAIDAIVPVPLHRTRLRDRGYNQSLELARPVAKRLRIPIRLDIERVRATAPQTSLSAEERRRNVRGAFMAHERVAGNRLALIDDVMTSGATAEMAARCLLAAGAAHVEVWVVARA